MRSTALAENISKPNKMRCAFSFLFFIWLAGLLWFSFSLVLDYVLLFVQDWLVEPTKGMTLSSTHPSVSLPGMRLTL